MLLARVCMQVVQATSDLPAINPLTFLVPVAAYHPLPGWPSLLSGQPRTAEELAAAPVCGGLPAAALVHGLRHLGATHPQGALQVN